MKIFSKITAVLLAFAILLCGCSAKKEPETLSEMAEFIAEGQLELFDGKLSAGTAVCDWTAIALSEFGMKFDSKSYLSDLENYVTEKYATEGKLDSTKATEWHRIILTATALGADATAFGENSDGSKINLVADGIYDYINEDLGHQGINAYIYALLALDCGGYEIPEDSRYTRESLLEFLLSEQQENGAFGFGGKSDVDMTAMALHALAKYSDDEKVKAAIESGFEYLSSEQNGDGTYTSFGAKTSESISQVIIALSANGIDPRTDERFIKHGTSVYDALFDFQKSDGTFSHNLDDEKGDVLATDQAMLAIISLLNFENGKSGAFIFTD